MAKNRSQMASSPQFADNQSSLRRAQAAAATPPGIQSRLIATPERHESRRVGRNGRVGSQKASRIAYNEAYCRKAQLPSGQVNPISKSLGSSILQRSREVLYNTLGIPRGKLTHTQMRKKWNLQPARRVLEKYFPALALAENQWAATCFLQEVARRDKKKDIDALSGEGRDGDEGGAEAGSRRLMMRNGFDGSEIGVFGEGAESQEVPAGAACSLRSGPHNDRPRARISPSSRHS